MNLEQYLEKYQISPAQFARNNGMSLTFINHHLQRGSTPHKRTCYYIEKVTNGEVTYADLRGEEDPNTIPRKTRKISNKKEDTTPIPDGYLTIAQAADLAKIAITTTSQLLQRKFVPSALYYIGGRIRRCVKTEDMLTYIRNRKIPEKRFDAEKGEISATEASKLLGLPLLKTYALIKQGILPAIKRGIGHGTYILDYATVMAVKLTLELQ